MSILNKVRYLEGPFTKKPLEPEEEFVGDWTPLDGLPLAYIIRLEDENIFVKMAAQNSVLMYQNDEGEYVEMSPEHPTLQDFLEYMRSKRDETV